jgi:hypothetical protein
VANLKRWAYEALDKTGLISGNPWRYVPCQEPVPIRDLISPLRLDILVRADFVEFCADNLGLFSSDFERFYQYACQQPYYSWYRNVNCARFSPHLLRDERAFRRGFENRIRNTVALYMEVQQEGFNPRHPIILQSGAAIKPTSTGKRTSRQVFAGDGCHRIALLVFMGQKALKPEYCKIRLFREFSPLDNTSILIRSTSIREEEYWAFLSLGYSEELFTTEDALLAHVRQEYPSRVPELKTIIAIDRALFEERSHETDGNQRGSVGFSVIQHIQRLSSGAASARVTG